MNLIFEVLVLVHVAFVCGLYDFLQLAVLLLHRHFKLSKLLLLEFSHGVDRALPTVSAINAFHLWGHHEHENVLFHQVRLSLAESDVLAECDVWHVSLKNVQLSLVGLNLAVFHDSVKGITHNGNHHIHHGYLGEECGKEEENKAEL